MTIEGVDINTNEQLFLGNNWVLRTDMDLINPATDAFVRKLAESGLSENSDEVFALQTAFREALINAMVHGNLKIETQNNERSHSDIAKEKQNSNPTTKHVYINLEISDDAVSITIRDEGDGFKPEEIPDPKEGEALLQSRGRGVFFMRQFVDEVIYSERGNEVKMIKKIGAMKKNKVN